ncbi:MAG: precorrin-6A reductase, partial [Syntrophomonadaceae bacterium]
SNSKQLKVLSGRLTREEMAQLMAKHQFDWVIDATHPYATTASENIQTACAHSGCQYIRLQREPSSPKLAENCFFKDHEEVVSYLNQTTGKILLTIGSKHLEKYTMIANYQQRLFARVLPTIEVLQSCLSMGFSEKQLLLMQGPFSLEFNVALIRHINARYLVTKDSGQAGGFLEKYEAARLTGAKLLVVDRCFHEEGISLEKVLELLENAYGS